MSIGEIALNRGAEEHMRHMQQLRMDGRSFFKIIFKGPVKRIHSVKDVRMDEHRRPDGTVEYRPIERDAVVEAPDMLPNPLTGQFEAMMYDDQECYNRHWLAKNKDALMIEIEDPKIARQITSLRDVEYKIPTTEKEVLLADKRRIDRELRDLDKKEKEAEEEEKEKKRLIAKAKELEKQKKNIEKEKEKPIDDMVTIAVKPEPEKPQTKPIHFVKV